MATNDVSDTRISVERLRELLATATEAAADPRETIFGKIGHHMVLPPDIIRSIITELLASRTQEPAEWQVEAVAKIVYELNPFHEGGEYVDGFLVSPGGDLSWDQACQRDQECAGVFLPVTKEARDTALKILRAASITPPAPEHSKEETGVRVKPLEWEPYPVEALQSDDVAIASIEDWRQQYQVQRDPWAAGYIAYLHPIKGVDSTLWWESKGHASIEEAKAAAQADYEQRIRSALETPPLHKEGEAIGLAFLDGLENKSGRKLYAAPVPVPVTITPETMDRVIEAINEELIEADVDYPAGRDAGHRIEFDEASMASAIAAALSAKPGEQG